jgi:Cu-Zn family superoxide dismutase
MKKVRTSKPNNGSQGAFVAVKSILSTAMTVLGLFLFLAACNPGNKQTDEGNASTEQPQDAHTEEDNASAKAQMEAASGSKVSGEANFTQEGENRVRFELTVENLTPGEHAVHIHEKGDCSAADASSAGGHWNPTMKPHGKRGDGTAYHKGDVGNMTVGNDGKGTISMTVEGWTIGGPDSTNVVGSYKRRLISTTHNRN